MRGLNIPCVWCPYPLFTKPVHETGARPIAECPLLAESGHFGVIKMPPNRSMHRPRLKTRMEPRRIIIRQQMRNPRKHSPKDAHLFKEPRAASTAYACLARNFPARCLFPIGPPPSLLRRAFGNCTLGIHEDSNPLG